MYEIYIIVKPAFLPFKPLAKKGYEELSFIESQRSCLGAVVEMFCVGNVESLKSETLQ